MERRVAKPNLGFKRVCGNCGTKFYDFARSPIVCPKCGTVYVVSASARAAAARAEPVAAAPEEAEIAPAEAEVISLEEADAETSGGKPAAGEADIDTDDDVEVETTNDDDDTFLEEEEEESGDVSDIIGEKLEDDREA
jgi:uncharacterized protein (TIGR02300 family)